MKAVALLILVLFVWSAPVRADVVGVYADNAGSVRCTPSPPPGPIVTFYVVHKFSLGTTGSRWKLVDSTGWTLLQMLYTAGTTTSPAGDGVDVRYAACTGPTFAIAQITYLAQQPTTHPCSALAIAPIAGESYVGVYRLAGNLSSGGFGVLHLAMYCDECTAPTEAATWGRVKALYR